MTALSHTAVCSCVFDPVLLHNIGICMIHSVISAPLHLHTRTHTSLVHAHLHTDTHTHTHTHVSCPVIICSALPCCHARLVNHRACMAQLKAIRAARNELALMFKGIFSSYFLPPTRNLLRGRKKKKLASIHFGDQCVGNCNTHTYEHLTCFTRRTRHQVWLSCVLKCCL